MNKMNKMSNKIIYIQVSLNKVKYIGKVLNLNKKIKNFLKFKRYRI